MRRIWPQNDKIYQLFQNLPFLGNFCQMFKRLDGLEFTERSRRKEFVVQKAYLEISMQFSKEKSFKLRPKLTKLHKLETYYIFMNFLSNLRQISLSNYKPFNKKKKLLSSSFWWKENCICLTDEKTSNLRKTDKNPSFSQFHSFSYTLLTIFDIHG